MILLFRISKVSPLGFTTSKDNISSCSNSSLTDDGDNIFTTSCFSSSDNSSGKNEVNFSGVWFKALRAAVPDIPDLDTIVLSSRLGYLLIAAVRLAISVKSSSLPSLAPITHNTSSCGFSLEVS